MTNPPTPRPAVRRLAAPSLVALLLAVVSTACGGDASATLTIRGARVSTPAGSTAAAYFTVTNDTDRADALTSITADRGLSASLHSTETDASGMSTMHDEPTMAVPAHGALVLEPGHRHVMLDGAAGLEPGDAVHFTLRFRHAGSRSIVAKVVTDVREGYGR
ncbi:MAG: copper chaperone PCu(A)C [Microthrixaceae bacterium]